MKRVSVTRMADKGAPHVVKFCESIASSASLVNLDIKPESWCEPRECFFNAKKYADMFGGAVQFGWIIWEWPSVYIEAEHHAVVVLRDGKTLFDVTPSDEGDVRRLFLPDNEATYDFNDKKNFRQNIRKSLVSDLNVYNFLKLSEELQEIRRNYIELKYEDVTFQDRIKINYIIRHLSDLKMEIFSKFGRPNDPCWCGSGLKYKKCHPR